MRRRTLLSAGLLSPLLAAADPLPAERLQRGGIALLLRHALTEPGIGDPSGFRLDDCRTQRNLSAAGRAQAQRIGAALRAVRIDELRASRWCRCLDTARLAFPGREVTPLDALNSFFEDRRDAPARTAALRSYISTLGTRNALLVTHMVNIGALTGDSVAMGEGVWVQADAAAPGGLRLLGRWRAD